MISFTPSEMGHMTPDGAIPATERESPLEAYAELIEDMRLQRDRDHERIMGMLDEDTKRLERERIKLCTLDDFSGHSPESNSATFIKKVLGLGSEPKLGANYAKAFEGKPLDWALRIVTFVVTETRIEMLALPTQNPCLNNCDPIEDGIAYRILFDNREIADSISIGSYIRVEGFIHTMELSEDASPSFPRLSDDLGFHIHAQEIEYRILPDAYCHDPAIPHYADEFIEGFVLDNTSPAVTTDAPSASQP